MHSASNPSPRMIAAAATRAAVAHAEVNIRTMVARGTSPRSAAAHALTIAFRRFPRADRDAVALQVTSALILDYGARA